MKVNVELYGNFDNSIKSNKLYNDLAAESGNVSSYYSAALQEANKYLALQQRVPMVIEYYSTPQKLESVKMYINPQKLSYSEQKVESKQLTRGGIFYNFWGNGHGTLSLSGTTGLAGMAGIDKIDEIYKASGILLKYKNYGNTTVTGKMPEYTDIEYNSALEEITSIVENIDNSDTNNRLDNLSQKMSTSELINKNEIAKLDSIIPGIKNIKNTAELVDIVINNIKTVTSTNSTTNNKAKINKIVNKGNAYTTNKNVTNIKYDNAKIESLKSLISKVFVPESVSYAKSAKTEAINILNTINKSSNQNAQINKILNDLKIINNYAPNIYNKGYAILTGTAAPTTAIKSSSVINNPTSTNTINGVITPKSAGSDINLKSYGTSNNSNSFYNALNNINYNIDSNIKAKLKNDVYNINTNSANRTKSQSQTDVNNLKLAIKNNDINDNSSQLNVLPQLITIKVNQEKAINDYLNRLSTWQNNQLQAQKALTTGINDLTSELTDPWLPRQVIIYFEDRAYLGHFDSFSYSRSAETPIINYDLKFTVTRTIIIKSDTTNDTPSPVVAQARAAVTKKATPSKPIVNKPAPKPSTKKVTKPVVKLNLKTTKTTKAVSNKKYTVKTGDSLWVIAEKMYGKKNGQTGWKIIYNANKSKINPKLNYRIYPGEQLVIPPFTSNPTVVKHQKNLK